MPPLDADTRIRLFADLRPIDSYPERPARACCRNVTDDALSSRRALETRKR
jgi:hypothetical protein